MARHRRGMKAHFSSWPPKPLTMPEAFRLVQTIFGLQVPVGAADHDLHLAAAHGHLGLGGHGVVAGVDQPVRRHGRDRPVLLHAHSGLHARPGRRTKAARCSSLVKINFTGLPSPGSGGPHRPGPART